MGRWKSRIGRMLEAAKDQPPPREAPIRERLPRVDEPSPFLYDEGARNKRQEAALSMVDDDTMGYVLLVLKRHPDGSGQIIPHFKMERSWHPAFARVMVRIVDEMERP